MIVDFNNIEFHLLEYGKFEVTNLFDTPSFTILWSRFTKIEGKFFSTFSFIGIMTREYCRKSRMHWGTESVVKGDLSLYWGRSFLSTKIGARNTYAFGHRFHRSEILCAPDCFSGIV